MSSGKEKSALRVPIVFLDEASRPAYHIFNPNDWTGESKSIVMSSAAQYSLLNYVAAQMPVVSQDCEQECEARFRDLRQQWRTAPWDLDTCDYLVEIPRFHVHAQAYLSGIKTFLDLLAQLVTTEGVVNKKVHGFHKKGRQIGGQLLQLLATRAYSAKKDVALQLRELVEEQKAAWIDQAVLLRDNLVHPEKGMHQVMFGLVIQLEGGEPSLAQILHPSVYGQDFGLYSREAMHSIHGFAECFLRTLKLG